MTIRPHSPQPGKPPTRLSPDLVADLSDWTVHLRARSFTRVSVDMLLRDLRRTVPSALGYTLVLAATPGTPEVSITVADERLTPGQVHSTIGFELPVAHDLVAAVTFYAGRTDAFDQLAALLRDSAGLSPGEVRVGQSLNEDLVPGVHGLADHTRVNYALGILLGRGESFDEAGRHLRRLAEQHGTLQAAAEHLLLTFGE
jgi:hypothetical protein